MHRSTRRSARRRLPASSAIGLVLALALVATPGAVSQQTDEPAPSGYSATATGSAVHADSLELGDTKLVNVAAAFSSAAADSEGLAPAQLNEMSREIHPALPEKMSYGRGSGLEVGAAVTPEDDNQIIPGGTAEASAPPSTDLVTEELLGTSIDPLVYADVLRGQAQAQWRDDACIVGSELGFGLGHATDLQLLDAGGDEEEETLDEPVLSTSASDPERATVESTSRTQLVGQRDADGNQIGDDFGILSETRQTFAPVTLFKDTENELTIEVLGEWVLQAVATGEDGGAYIHYGPEDVSPQTTVIRILQGGEEEFSITAQDFFDNDGFTLEIDGIAELAIGEPPRAIGGPAGSEPTVADDGTEVGAAVDVVRAKVLDQPDSEFQGADIRVGHMEASGEVPAGGIACEIPVEKDAVSEVEVGDTFDVSIPVTNTYDCTIDDVGLTDEITTEGDAAFTVLDTSPAADEVPAGEALSEGTVVWDDLGSIAPGETIDVTVTLRADDGPGDIIDVASISATIGDCPAVEVGDADVAPTGAEVNGTSDEVRIAVVEEAAPPDDDIAVSKSADPDSGEVGDEATFAITVQNTFECTLTDLRVEDAITTEGDARFEVTGTDPEADEAPVGAELSEGTVVWDDVDPIDAGESASFMVTIELQGGGGTVNDVADATATLADCEGDDAGRDGEEVDGTSEVLGVAVEDALRLNVSKQMSEDSVSTGDSFTANILLQNTYDCVLRDVTITDEITTEGDARFAVVGTSPQADEVPQGGERSEGTVVWRDVGPVEAGETVSVAVTIEAQGGGGRIHDLGRAEATLTDCEGSDEGLSGVDAEGAAVGEVETVAVLGERLERRGDEPVLPRTGGDAGPLAAMGAGLVALGLTLTHTARHLRRRRRGAYWERFSI